MRAKSNILFLVFYILILSFNSIAQHAGYSYYSSVYGRYVTDRTIQDGLTNMTYFQVTPTSDEGYVVSGGKAWGSGNFPYIQARIIKYDANDKIQWEFNQGDSIGAYVYPSRVVELPDYRGYLFSINYDATNPHDSLWYSPVGGVQSGDFALFQLDTSGDLVWSSRAYGGTKNEGVGEIHLASDGSLTLRGETDFSNDYDFQGFVPNIGTDVFIWKMDTLGNILWKKYISSKHDDHLYGMVMDDAGGCYIMFDMSDSTSAWAQQYYYDTVPGGYCTSTLTFYIAHLDRNGDVVWCHRYGGKGWVISGSLLYDKRRQKLIVQCFSQENTTGIFSTRRFRDGQFSKVCYIMTLDTLGMPESCYPYGPENIEKIKAPCAFYLTAMDTFLLFQT